ncbi:hypothetical protein TRFO_17381 [Tritrichomonas foetus]|uniref:Uncharacterized protein n=1 Tax=Tritrichomonas foetus TaxID=1144522 RepID=A0A1J4KNN7_9EUKA|nr:hypothetical protein TRFO_17381 [Tritrichomonas foetus]|eukprot:OHT12746.1 hypothetical protein TRFO_17381 [Tritrichomonas foetus]
MIKSSISCLRTFPYRTYSACSVERFPFVFRKSSKTSPFFRINTFTIRSKSFKGAIQFFYRKSLENLSRTFSLFIWSIFVVEYFQKVEIILMKISFLSIKIVLLFSRNKIQNHLNHISDWIELINCFLVKHFIVLLPCFGEIRTFNKIIGLISLA